MPRGEPGELFCLAVRNTRLASTASVRVHSSTAEMMFPSPRARPTAATANNTPLSPEAEWSVRPRGVHSRIS